MIALVHTATGTDIYCDEARMCSKCLVACYWLRNREGQTLCIHCSMSLEVRNDYQQRALFKTR